MWNTSTLSDALSFDVKVKFDTQNTSLIQINSMNISHGDIFIALLGATLDGHDYISDALKRGASCAIASRLPKGVDPSKVIIVNNVDEALTKMAIYKRNHSNAKFVGITGSVGKTSTKEFLKSLLYPKCYASRGNFNNYLGVRVDMASMNPNTHYAIFEMGMNHPREISEISKLIKPDIGIITGIGPAHIGNFKNIYGIIDAKLEILHGYDIGPIVLPIDSPYYDILYKNVPSKYKIYSFGQAGNSHSKMTSYNNNIATYDVFGRSIAIKANIAKHHYGNLGCAVLTTVLLEADIETDEVFITNMDGRGAILNLKMSGKPFVLIDESYNSNPMSLGAAIQNLEDYKDRKILILGDMLELGKNAEKYHIDILYILENLKNFIVITYGNLMKKLHLALVSKKHNSNHFDDLLKLQEHLSASIMDNDVLMIKGSSSMGLSKIVQFLKANDENNDNPKQ